MADHEKQRCSASIHNDPDKPQGVNVDDVQKQLTEKDVPAGTVEYTAEEVALNKRVNRKMDFAMLPVLSLLYLFNGLDKGNVGNAETQGESCCSRPRRPRDASRWSVLMEQASHATSALSRPISTSPCRSSSLLSFSSSRRRRPWAAGLARSTGFPP